jgi:hypothetical protein
MLVSDCSGNSSSILPLQYNGNTNHIPRFICHCPNVAEFVSSIKMKHYPFTQTTFTVSDCLILFLLLITCYSGHSHAGCLNPSSSIHWIVERLECTAGLHAAAMGEGTPPPPSKLSSRVDQTVAYHYTSFLNFLLILPKETVNSCH